jgi:hypothetical protein
VAGATDRISRRLLSRIRTTWGVLALTLATVPLLPTRVSHANALLPLPPVTVADGRLGLCDVLPGSPPGSSDTWATLAHNAGARLDRWEFRWDSIEPSNGRWNFQPDDDAVAAARAAGLQVVGVIDGTPRWAAAKGQPPGNGLPRGLTKPYTNPKNIWAAFVRGTVSHYQGQVTAWEIWNEPDVPTFWHGTADDYFAALKAAYLTIKAVDPSAQVLIAGMVVPNLTFLSTVLVDARSDPESSAEHGYFDAAAWHGYGQARLLYANVLNVRDLLASDGFPGVPVWVTEDGFPASNPNGSTRQAAYVLESIAYALAAGASHVLIYRASDDALPKTWGLVSATGVLRPGYLAFQVASTYFAGARAIVYSPGAHLERFTLYEPGRRVTLLWSREQTQTIDVMTAAGSGAALVDWQGNATQLVPTNGTYSIPVPGADYNAGIDLTNSSVGGPPLMLIESNSTLPSPSQQTVVTPLSGQGRRLAVFNPGTAPVTATITANGRPVEHQLITIDPQNVKVIDVNLLAGPTYAGYFGVASDGVLMLRAYSDSGETGTEPTSSRWYLSDTAATTITNLNSHAITAFILGYVAGGAVKVRTRVTVPAHASRQYVVPTGGRSTIASLTINTSQPVALIPVSGGAATSTSRLWYAVRPQSPYVTLFNPSASAANVTVKFVGSSTVTAQRVRIAPNGTVVVPMYDARAAIINSTSPLAAESLGSAGRVSSISATQIATSLAGPITSTLIFNASAAQAHVTEMTVSGAAMVERSIVLGSSRVATFTARQAGTPPSGVIVRSDVPVVSIPVDPAEE